MKEIVLLTQALHSWEDRMIIAASDLRINEKRNDGQQTSSKASITGPFKHYQNIEQHLKSAPLPNSVFDTDRFLGNRAVQICSRDFGGIATTLLPYTLYEWSKNSKKVYTISEELQLLLSQTSLEGITWNDIKWPFESFYVEVPIPFTDEHGKNSYSGIMVNKNSLDPYNPLLQISIFSEKLRKYEPIPHDKKILMQDKIIKGKWPELLTLHNKYVRKFMGDNKYHVEAFFVDKNHHNDLVTNQARTFYEGDDYVKIVDQKVEPDDNLHIAWDEAVRIIVGLCLCLYLTSLERGGTYYINKQKKETATIFTLLLKKNEIHFGAEVFSVNSSVKLTEGERKVIMEIKKTGSMSKSLRAYFRTGHFRRPPGKGNDSSAVKTVWVRPTLVGRKYLSEENIPLTTENLI